MADYLNVDTAMYLYKCLLRKRQALSYLRPIDALVEVSVDEAIKFVSGFLSDEDIRDADKQMSIVQAQSLQVFVDASVKDNNDLEVQSRASISFIVTENKNVLYEKAVYLGTQIELTLQDKALAIDISGNVAEYMAVIKALEFIADSQFRGPVEIYSDSELVVRQINFASRTRSPKLIVLRDYARRLMSKSQDIVITHLHREDNVNADALAKTAVET